MNLNNTYSRKNNKNKENKDYNSKDRSNTLQGVSHIAEVAAASHHHLYQIILLPYPDAFVRKRTSDITQKMSSGKKENAPLHFTGSVNTHTDYLDILNCIDYMLEHDPEYALAYVLSPSGNIVYLTLSPLCRDDQTHHMMYKEIFEEKHNGSSHSDYAAISYNGHIEAFYMALRHLYPMTLFHDRYKVVRLCNIHLEADWCCSESENTGLVRSGDIHIPVDIDCCRLDELIADCHMFSCASVENTAVCKKTDLQNKYVFWDIDGTLAPYRFNGHLADPDGTDNGMSLKEINDHVFLTRKPSLRMQKVLYSCGSHKNIVMGHYQVKQEYDDKQIWLDKYFPMITDRLLIFENNSKADAILSYCKQNHIDLNDVVFVDDVLRFLRDAKHKGITSFHISSFLDYDLECTPEDVHLKHNKHGMVKGSSEKEK